MSYHGDKSDVTSLVKYAQDLEAEIERLRGNNATLDAVVASIADELGCAADNEAILAAIERLRDGQAGG